MTAEVNAVADMGDIAVNLPQPRADELTRAIDEYLRTVVNDELPMMAEGRVNPATTRALTGLWVPLGNYEPQAEWEVSIREIAINKAMDIGEPWSSVANAFVALALFSIHVLERPFQYHLSPESSDYISLWKALGGPETITR